jgi:hypothetical protein
MPLLDQFGRPAQIAYSGTGAQIYEGSQDTNQRLSRPNLDTDISRLLSRQKHRMLLSDARYIATTFPLVAGAVSQKADYVSSGGWFPYFTGKDKAYGAAATPILHAALRTIDARGPLFPFDRTMWIGCGLLDVDGDWFIARSRTESGWPQIQCLEAHRIGCRMGERIVVSGRYKDLPILNGVIYNLVGRPVAFRFLGDTPEQDQDISARDLDWVAAPRWFSDGRPFPSIAYAVLDWYDVKETRGFEKLAAKVNSALSLIVENDTGAAPTGVESTLGGTQTPETSTAPVTELLMGGLIRYVKFNAGKIHAHSASRPADGWLKFDERIVAGAFYGMNWRIEMFDLSKLSGAPTRGFQDNINTAIHSRWGTLTPAAHRTVLHAISALADRGDIPRHPEWDQWAFPPPVDFTVDANKDSQTARANIAFGLSTHATELRRTGYANPESILRSQAQHIAHAQRIAKEESVEGAQVDWRDLLNLSPTGQIAYNQPGEQTAAPASGQAA